MLQLDGIKQRQYKYRIGKTTEIKISLFHYKRQYKKNKNNYGKL